MTTADWIGSAGVALLLLAFLLNLLGRLNERSRLYAGMNATGAALAAWASFQIGFVPFVILEGTWMAAALYALFKPAAPPA